jgi:hypothetical protein
MIDPVNNPLANTTQDKKDYTPEEQKMLSDAFANMIVSTLGPQLMQQAEDWKKLSDFENEE